MRSLGVRLPILAATAWAGIGFTAWSRDFGYRETAYYVPTSASVVWPTSYVYPSSYVPTTYGYSSYWPTTYVNDASYLTTAYSVRRGLFGRLRLVERPVIASYATTYSPTAYYLPNYYSTSYLATSYYAPTSYYSYYRPTSYYSPTVYYTPTVYAPTVSYRTTSYIPTVYTPTSYEYPRVWESAYVSSSDSDCDQVAWVPPTATYPAPSPRMSAPVQSYAAPRSSVAPQAIQSEPADDQGISSNVDSAPAPPADNSPPIPPAAPREKNTSPPNAAGTPKDGGAAPGTAKPLTPPAAPGAPPAGINLEPAPPGNADTNRRETLRPAVYGRLVRPVLVGRIESDAGEPLGEVPVSVISRDNRSIARAGMSDAYGKFAIRLDDGEWTVNVRMPSGRLYAVRSVTVRNGVVLDDQERREVRNLIISY